MNSTRVINSMSKFALATAAGLLVACGGSGGGSDTTAVTGTIVAAPVNGADVSVSDGINTVAGPVKTSAEGEYTLNIPNASLADDLYIEASGGSFTDEASGATGTGGEMQAYIAANSLTSGDSVSVTPGSTIIAHLVRTHSRTMTQAQNAFANAFGWTPDLSIVPADATTAPAAGEDAASTLAGFRAAAFSQLALDLGLSQDQQFELFAALAKDLSDDSLDGVDASGVVAIGTTGKSLEANIQNRFAQALMNFQANARNLTGLNNAQIGNPPFAKVALTANYQIEYRPTGTMAPMNGKSSFQIHVANRSDGSDATGLAIMLMPMMHMASHEHSTPKAVTAVSEDGNGLYTVTLYYLMPSQMMDGTTMGIWNLKLVVAGEEAHFYPAVMMAMGDTLQVRLKGDGVTDKVMDMNTGLMVGRTYFIFKEGLSAGSGMGLYDFSVFVAAQETMMNFPAIVNGIILNSGEMNELTVSAAEVELSANGGSWQTAVTSGADGVWAIADLPLNNGVANEIRVRLRINGEIKTTDGAAQDPDVNDFQTFSVTPGMTM